MELNDLPLFGIAATAFLLLVGFVSFHQPTAEDEEQSDRLWRKVLGVVLMVAGVVSLGLTVTTALA